MKRRFRQGEAVGEARGEVRGIAIGEARGEVRGEARADRRWEEWVRELIAKGQLPPDIDIPSSGSNGKDGKD